MRKGYNPEFLGHTVPLPSFSESLEKDVLERDTLSPDASGRCILRHYHNYTTVISKRYRTALFAALNIDQSLLEKTDKTEGWRIDEEVGAEHQLNDVYYRGNVWDKGHLAPDASAGWGKSVEERVLATNDTYFYTNASLQHENFNRDEWKDLESWVRTCGLLDNNATTNKLSEITGPIWATDRPPQIIQPKGRQEARIPDGFFKVLAYVKKKKLQVLCFVIYQDSATLLDRKGEVVDYKQYQVDITKIEHLTQLVFDPIYHQAAANNNNQTTTLNNNMGDDESAPSVAIAAAMVNPKGKDSGNEWISLFSSKSDAILQGWKMKDQGGRNLLLKDVQIQADSTVTLYQIKPLRLTNSGGSLFLYNSKGELVDQVKYTKHLVKEGVAVTFR